MGGLHTAVCIQQLSRNIEEGTCTNPNLTDVPQGWLEWPCKPYFFPKSLEFYWRPLLALGNIDNESIQLEVTWYGKVSKCRELFVRRFGTYEQYKQDLEDATKPTGAVAKELIAEWCDGVKEALQIRQSQFAHMRQIVCQPESLWLLYDKLLRREYKKYERKQSRKGKSTKTVTTTQEGYEPMGSPNELFPFLGLPSSVLEPLFQLVLEGRITFKAAQVDAMEWKATARLARVFEERFNELGGMHHKTRAKRAGKWISFDAVQAKVVDVARQAQSWTQTFGAKRKKMTPYESNAFQEFVEQARTAYYNLGKKEKKTVDLPPQFSLILTEEQKRALRGGQDVKFDVVESKAGGSHSVLLINDANEALGHYLNSKECKFGACSLFELDSLR